MTSQRLSRVVSGVTLAMQGKFDEAALNFGRAVGIDPDHTDAADHLRRIQSRWHVVIGIPVLQELGSYDELSSNPVSTGYRRTG